MFHLTNLIKNLTILKANYNVFVIEGKESNYSEAFLIEKYINKGKIKIKRLGIFKKSQKHHNQINLGLFILFLLPYLKFGIF